MKKLFNFTFFLLTTLCFSCVELPNLIPNGNGNDSDMHIFEYENVLLESSNDWLINENGIKLRLIEVYDGGSCAVSQALHLANGELLGKIANDSIGGYISLTATDMIAGFVLGAFWQDNITYNEYFLDYACNYIFIFPKFRIPATDAFYLGLRIKIDNLWHYGWIYIQRDENNKPNIKKIAINKNAGLNARIIL